MADTRPNIIMIMTDQQRGDCLHCDGNDAIETPYLDDLAARGTRFPHAYTATPSCLPARASLLTGMDQWHTGILGMGRGQGHIPSNFIHTLPGELAQAGYHTQSIGKNHYNPQRALNGYHNTIIDESGRAESPGFVSDYRRWFEQHKDGPYHYRDHSVDWNSWMSRPSHLPEHLHPTWWTAEQSIQFLSRRDPQKPFFLKTSFARPHSPYDPPQRYYDMYRDVKMPDASVGKWSAMHDDPTTAMETNAWRGMKDPRLIERARQCYYGSVTFIDHQIGRLLYELQRNDRETWLNTMVIFFSDHGDMLGDHHLWRKTYAYEGSTRVPMIIAPPANWGMPTAQVRDEVVEIRDIMPTLLDAAGAAIPDTVRGKSMMPLTRGESTAWRDYLHGEHCFCYGPDQANHYITDGKTKYVYLPYLGVEQLFDLTTDPGECHDLSGDEARLAPWRQRLVDELMARNCGTAKDGKLVHLDPDATITSPHYRKFNCRQD
jgi:choline-sulfatase